MIHAENVFYVRYQILGCTSSSITWSWFTSIVRCWENYSIWINILICVINMTTKCRRPLVKIVLEITCCYFNESLFDYLLYMWQVLVVETSGIGSVVCPISLGVWLLQSWNLLCIIRSERVALSSWLVLPTHEKTRYDAAEVNKSETSEERHFKSRFG